MKNHKYAVYFRRYLLAPPKCMFCRSEQCTPSVPLCKACYPKYTEAYLKGCSLCGAPTYSCRCFSVKNCVELYWLFNYETAEIKRMVNMMKHIRDAHTFRFIAARLADRIHYIVGEKLPYDCVCYVPRNRKSKLLYNHDHAEELALELARFLSLPCLPLLKHTGVAGEQKQLARKFRGDAAKLRFEVNEKMLINGKLPCKTPLLVDDIVTTGATAGECAHILREYGAKRVALAFVAHTP